MLDRHITTPSRRRDDMPVPTYLPQMRDPQVIISLEEYRAYERFLEVFTTVESAIARGRLEAKIEAYELVLNQVKVSNELSAVRQPALISSLEQLIATWKEDLVMLEAGGAVPTAASR